MTDGNIWDSPELKPDADYVKFEAIGDEVAGIIQAIRVHRWDDGSVSPKIQLLCDDGEERTLTAGQIKLKVALAEARPEPGDHIRIRLTQVEKRAGGKTLKHFDVKVGAAPSQPAAVVAKAEPATPVVDQAAIAAALANLTPEQLASLKVS